MDNYFDTLDDAAETTSAASTVVKGPENFFDETAGEAPARPGANETIVPKTTPGRTWKDDMLDGMSLDTAQEKARVLTRSMQANPRPETPQEASERASFGGALTQAATSLQVEALANTADYLADATGYASFTALAKSLRDSVNKDGSDYKAVYESYRDVNGMADVWGYMKERAGQMVGGMVPSLVGGAAGGIVGSIEGGTYGKTGALVGGVAGATAGAALGTVHLHISDMRDALIKNGMKDKEQLTKYTTYGAAAMVSLDTAFPVFALSKLGGGAKRWMAGKVAEKMMEAQAKGVAMPTVSSFVRDIGKEMAKGLTIEISTELMQQAITDLKAKQWAGKDVTEADLRKFALETAPEVILSTAIGAGFMSLPGSVLHGAANVRDARAAVQDEQAAAAGAGEETAPEPGAPKLEMRDGKPAPADQAAAEAAAPQQVDPSIEQVAPGLAGKKAVTALQFIRENGGIQPSGELDALDAHRYPGLINGGGLSADEMRERLVEGGYLEESGPDAPAVTTPADVFDIVRRSVSGERIVPVADQMADDAFFAARDAKDAQRELEYSEKSIVLPEIEQIDEQLVEPVFMKLFKAFGMDDRMEAIDRIRRGEHADDVIEQITIKNVDVEGIQAMAVARGPDPEMVDRFRSMLAQQAPDMLEKFDDILATFPVRRPRAAKPEVALAPPMEVAASPETYAAYDGAISADSPAQFSQVLQRIDTPSLKAMAKKLGTKVGRTRATLLADISLKYLQDVRGAKTVDAFNEIRGRFKSALLRRSEDIAAAQPSAAGSPALQGSEGADRLRDLPELPAVPVGRSVAPTYLASLIDGSKISDLGKYLAKINVDPENYRRTYHLEDSYPTLTPNEVSERYESSGARARETYESFEKQFTIGALKERIHLDGVRAQVGALSLAEKKAFAEATFPETKFRSGKEVLRAVAQETDVAKLEAGLAKVRPAAQEAPARNLSDELRNLIAAKVPSTQWAARLGVSDVALKPVIDSLSGEGGIIRRDRRGVAQPDMPSGNLTVDQVVADLTAHYQAIDSLEAEEFKGGMEGKETLRRPRQDAIKAWITKGEALAGRLRLMSKPDAVAAAEAFMGMKLGGAARLSRAKVAEWAANRFRWIGDSTLKNAMQTGRGAAMAFPGRVAGQDDVMLTNEALDKAEKLEQVVRSAVAGILPEDVAIDVQQQIDLGRIAREDQLFALSSGTPDIVPQTRGSRHGRVVEGRPAAGREGGEAGARGAPARGAARPGEGTETAGNRGDAGLEGAGAQRIVRQESATLRKDGSVYVGRPVKKKGSTASRDSLDPQRIGQTLRLDFPDPDYIGRVEAEPLESIDRREGNVSRLVYRVYPKGIQVTEDTAADAEMHVVQHSDGAWEIEAINVEIPRMGLGTKLYNAVEKDLGIRMSPSGVLSDEGLAFWKKRSPESVKWHQKTETWAGFNFSPRKIKSELDRVGRELVRVTQGQGTAARIPEFERDKLVVKLRSERGKLITMWAKTPAEARTAVSTMFSLGERTPEPILPADRPRGPGLAGFYSPAIRAAQNVKLEKGPGSQFYTMIAKTPGVKKDELDWMGLEEWLKARPSITKASVLDYMEAHQVAMDETVLGTPPARKDVIPQPVENFAQTLEGKIDADLQATATALWRIEYGLNIEDRYYIVETDDPDGSGRVGKYYEAFAEANSQGDWWYRIGGSPNFGQIQHIIAGDWADDAPATRVARFQQWKVKGGESYREFLLRMPALGKPEMSPEDSARQDQLMAQAKALRIAREELIEFSSRSSPTDADRQEYYDREDALVAQRRPIMAEIKALERKYIPYKSKHFKDTELVHVRADDREGDIPGGKKNARILFINEVQSDGHQFGRRFGYALTPEQRDQMKAEARREIDAINAELATTWDPDVIIPDERAEALNTRALELDNLVHQLEFTAVPNMPMKGDLYWELGMKRMLQFAVEKGYDAISWANAAQIAKAVGAKPESLTGQYDKKMPSFMAKFSAKWGGKVIPPAFTPELLATKARDELRAMLGGQDPDTFDTDIMDAWSDAQAAAYYDRVEAWRTGTDSPTFSADGSTNYILEITPEMRAGLAEPQPLFSYNGERQNPQPMGMADPYANSISIALGAIEDEARRTGRSMAAIARATARHEAMEFFLANHIISADEWVVLQRAAVAGGWIDTTGIRERYTKMFGGKMGPNQLNELILKEAIMETYGRYRAGEYKPAGKIAAIMKKIADFLDKMKNGLRGQGFQNWEDVFRRTDAGEMKARYEAIYGTAQANVRPDFWATAKGMDVGLAGDTARAMDQWVGGPHDAVARGVTGGLMIPEPLESMDDATIEAMAKPMRDALRASYGNVITVYRGEAEGGGQSTGRKNKLISYSMNRKVAERFAGTGQERPIISDAEIAAAEEALSKTGKATLGGRTFRNEGEMGIMMYDRDGQALTDTPSIRAEAESLNEYADERNAEHGKALQRVRAVQIPVDAVIWATDRFNQQEIIARAGNEMDAGSATPQPMVRAGQVPDARGLQPGINAQAATVQRPGAIARAREIVTGTAANAVVTGQLRGITELLTELGTAMNLSMRTGRLDRGLRQQARAAGTELMGMYNGVARSDIARDIDNLTHEGGHHLERTVPGLRAAAAANAAELVPLAGALGNPVSEGFAEFFRRYITNEPAARRLAPNFYRNFEALLATHDRQMLDSLHEVQEAYEEFIVGDDVEQGLANQTVLRREPTGVLAPFKRAMQDAERDGFADTFSDRMSWLYQNLVASTHGFWLATRDLLEIVQERTGQRLTLAAEDNPTKLLRMTSHTNGWALESLKEGIPLRARASGGGVSMHQVLATAFGNTERFSWNDRAVQEFGEYLIARNAIQEWIRFRPALRQVVQAFVAGSPRLNYLLQRLPQNVDSERPEVPTSTSLNHHLRKLERMEQRFPRFRQAAELYYSFNRDMVTFMHEKGLISSEQLTEYLKEKDYAPQMRDMSDREEPAGGGRASRRDQTSDHSRLNKLGVFRRRRGSYRDIINPVQSTVQQVYEMHLKAAINDTLAALDRLARQAGPGGNAIFERLPETEARVIQANVREVLRQAARDVGLTPNDTTLMLTNVENTIGTNIVTTLFTQQQTNERGEKIVWFYENGRPIPAQLADGSLGRMMFEGLTANGARNGGLLLGLIGAAATSVRMGVTTAFEFIFRNVFVDSIAAAINSPYASMIPFKTAIGGAGEILRGGQYHHLYNRYAGMMGGAASAALNDQSIERDVKLLRQRGFNVRRPRSLPELAGMIFKLGEFSETSTRVGIFRNAMRSFLADGMAEQAAAMEAAHYAHDVMDFSRHGSKTERTRRMIPFFQASINGLDKYTRTLTAANDYGRLISIWQRYQSGQPLSAGETRALGQAARAWALTTLALGGMSAFCWWLSQDDEDKDEIPDSIRYSHWVISINDVVYLLPKGLQTFIGYDGNTDEKLRLPKPFEMAWFANGVERALDGAVNGDKKAAAGYAKDFWNSVVPPDSIPGLDLAYGFWFGKDAYTGNDIIPFWEKDKARQDQFGPYTTETAKQLGKQFNIAPYYLDYLVRGLFASQGRDVMGFPDILMGKGPQAPISQFPIARRFTSNTGRSSKSISAFYNAMRDPEGLSNWFWDTMQTDARSFIAGATSYGDRLKSGDLAEARRYLDTLNPNQQVFAVLSKDFTGQAKAKYRNLHPMLNAQEGVSVTNSMMKEIVGGKIKLGKDGKDGELALSRTEMRDLRNEISHVRKGMAQNGMKIIGMPGWDHQPMADVDKRLAVVKAAKPAVHAELIRRLREEKFVDAKEVAKSWPKVKDRIITQRGDAELSDLYPGAIEPAN